MHADHYPPEELLSCLAPCCSIHLRDAHDALSIHILLKHSISHNGAGREDHVEAADEHGAEDGLSREACSCNNRGLAGCLHAEHRLMDASSYTEHVDLLQKGATVPVSHHTELLRQKVETADLFHCGCMIETTMTPSFESTGLDMTDLQPRSPSLVGRSSTFKCYSLPHNETRPHSYSSNPRTSAFTPCRP